MTESRAAHRYALALFGLAEEMKQLEAVGNDLRSLQDLLKGSKELLVFLKSPVVNREKKKTVLSELLKGKVSEMTFQFVKLLAQKHREDLLPDIINQFNALWDEKRGIVPVTVTTASPFTKEQEGNLVEQFRRLTKKTPRLQFVDDPSLKGGFSLQYEDTVWDGSVRHQLEQLRKRLTQGTA